MGVKVSKVDFWLNVCFKNEPVLRNCQFCEPMQHLAVLKSSYVL